MGQRLVVDCIYNDEVVANIYYHWSAYTVDAYYEMRRIITHMRECDFNSKKDLQRELLNCVQNQGGGIGSNHIEDFKYAKDVLKVSDLNETPSRNEGLIAFTADGITSNHKWAEGFSELDFDRNVAINDLFWAEESVEQYAENNDKKAEDVVIKTAPFDVEVVKFDDIEKVEEWVRNNIGNLIEYDCQLLSAFYW